MLKQANGLIYCRTKKKKGLQLSETIITMNSQNIKIDHHCYRDDHEADDHQLPGFRFHPTDEELVGFYLRRKVDKKPLSIELIKQIDIYKHDPWDLPKISSTPDNEGYFFCKRGRKYRNSVRPNRVTGSGFWKATGIDKPVYSDGGEGQDCIGLKKTLVYYRGTAGKGTKTDWMMNEFRLPSDDRSGNTNVTNAKTTLPEAEVWTICRVFKRNVSSRKYTNWKEQSSARRQSSVTELPSATITYSTESNNQEEAYISFENPGIHRHTDNLKPTAVHQINEISQFSSVEQLSGNIPSNPYESMASSSSHPHANGNDFHELFTQENWDELRSVVEFALECPNFSF